MSAVLTAAALLQYRETAYTRAVDRWMRNGTPSRIARTGGACIIARRALAAELERRFVAAFPLPEEDR